MPVVLAMHFPWGRYHATPWGRYVNEGLVEVPPSPWRLLRALYAAWQTRAPELDQQVVHSLLAALAIPPSYRVPPYRIAHTRHYYPDSKHRSGSASTDKAVDAFAVLDGDQTIYALWPIDLNPDQREALNRLAKSIPYIGRADSTCDVQVLDQIPPKAAEHGCAEPIGLDDDALTAHHQSVEVLCPELPLDLEALIQRPVDIRAAKLGRSSEVAWAGCYIQKTRTSLNAERLQHRVVRLGSQIPEILVIGLRNPLPTFVLKCAEVDLSHVCLHPFGTLARWSAGFHVPRKGIACLLREQSILTAEARAALWCGAPTTSPVGCAK